MKPICGVLPTLTIGIALVSSAFAAAPANSEVRQSMIVTTDWLAKHLSDDSLVLLQVGERKDYDAEHIPGAQFIQLSDISTPRGQGWILELPSVDQLKATFENQSLAARRGYVRQLYELRAGNMFGVVIF